ncbi:MAG: DUF1287 domain-containing protein [Desulfosporosinus sp.]
MRWNFINKVVRSRAVIISLILLGLIIWLGIKLLFSPQLKSPLGEYISIPGISIQIPNISCPSDKDNDGVNDLEDIVKGARSEVMRKPKYLSSYYQGGFPPNSEGVCTDVVWRAMRDAGYDLKTLVDKDIRENIASYPRLADKPDPNIDFRRVPNLIVFFRKHAVELTKEIKPGDVDNLYLWQAGDIVTYDYPHEHIAMVSDKRRKDGVPYILHNAGPYASETDQLQDWPSQMTGHFRFPKF